MERKFISFRAMEQVPLRFTAYEGATQESSRNIMSNMSSNACALLHPGSTVNPLICQIEIFLIPHVLGNIE